MIIGSVTKQREAVVNIHLEGTNGETVQLPAVIDTGFDGSLGLPAQHVARLGYSTEGLRAVILADGSKTELPYYWATVIWHGIRKRVLTIEAENGALVGMVLLTGSSLHVDVINDGTVRIEPIEL